MRYLENALMRHISEMKWITWKVPSKKENKDQFDSDKTCHEIFF